MAIININNKINYKENIPNIGKIYFFHLGQKTYSANKFNQIVGTFTSNILDGGEKLIRWNEFDFEGNNSGIKFFIKNASSKEDLQNASWVGPYVNKNNSLRNFKKRYLQFLVIIVDNGNQNGTIESLNLSLVSSQNTVKFFSKSFDVGFSPELILVSYNGNASEDAIIRFAVAGENTIDTSKYFFLEPNKITDISDFSVFSKNLKIMIEMSGDSQIPITIDEFSVMFSGDEYKKINKEKSTYITEEEKESVQSSLVGSIIIGTSKIA